MFPLLTRHRQSASATERALQTGVVVDILCRDGEVSDASFIQAGEERVGGGYSDSGNIDFLIVIQTRGVLRVNPADTDFLKNIALIL